MIVESCAGRHLPASLVSARVGRVHHLRGHDDGRRFVLLGSRLHVGRRRLQGHRWGQVQSKEVKKCPRQAWKH